MVSRSCITTLTVTSNGLPAAGYRRGRPEPVHPLATSKALQTGTGTPETDPRTAPCAIPPTTAYNLTMSLLWFRRSRRSGDKPDAAPAENAAAAPPQGRVPLRIRNLLLLNLQPDDGAAQIETAPPLGGRAAVVGAIRNAIPGIEFADARGELSREDGRVAIDLGPHDPVHAAVAEAEGDSGIELLRSLLEQCRWRAYAPKAGVFIAPDALDLFALPDGGRPGTPA
jgi:hypothetical protein